MQEKRHLTHEQVKQCTLEIARQIYKDKWHPEYLVGITRGGLWPGVMLSHYLGITMYTLDIRLRDGDDAPPETNERMAKDAYAGKNILIVDDINDTGETLKWLTDDWKNTVWESNKKWDQEILHKNVKFACWIDNLPSKFEIDYQGMEINKEEDPRWIVFPHEGWWQL